VAGNGHIDLAETGRLTFLEPDFKKFPLLGLGFDIARRGGTLPAVYNAANESAVAAFLNDTIKFKQIPDIVVNTVEKHNNAEAPSYEEILEADRWARETAKGIIG